MNTRFPLVSVIVPAYGHEKFIQFTLKSLIDQTYPALELILINDGSKDQTHQKITELDSQLGARFSPFIYINRQNLGLARTLNEAILLAQGELVFILSSDDIACSEAIEKLVVFFTANSERFPNLAMVCGDAQFIDENNKPCYQKKDGRIESQSGPESYSSFVNFHTHAKKNFNLENDFGTYKSFLSGNFIPVGLLFKRQALIDTGLYDPQFCYEDWEMWLRLSKKYSIKYTPETLCKYRLHLANSGKVLGTKMFFDSIRILAREKDYCVQNRLTKEWSSQYTDCMLMLLKCKEWRKFLKDVQCLSLFQFFAHLTQRLMKKLFGMSAKDG